MKLHTSQTQAEITFSSEKFFQVNISRLHFTSLRFTSLDFESTRVNTKKCNRLQVDSSEQKIIQSTSSRLEWTLFFLVHSSRLEVDCILSEVKWTWTDFTSPTSTSVINLNFLLRELLIPKMFEHVQMTYMPKFILKRQ